MKPMKTVEAYSKLMCENCKTGKFDKCKSGSKETDCVETQTCSTDCGHCRQRVWFTGDWLKSNTPDDFKCPYCGKEVSSPYKGL